MIFGKFKFTAVINLVVSAVNAFGFFWGGGEREDKLLTKIIKKDNFIC
jgi:hypothetical protein